MSEKEKLQRSMYQERRKQGMIRLAIIAAVITALLLGVGTIFFSARSDNYVFYSEEGSAIYKAYLRDNEFYTEEYLNGSHAYVAALVDRMTADFSYRLTMDSASADYRYSYYVEAQLEVRDKTSQMAIFNPVYLLKESTMGSAEGKELVVEDVVDIDFTTYNNRAKEFMATYNLEDADAQLIVRMCINTNLNGRDISKDGSSYVIAVHIPLAEVTVAPYVETPVATEAQKMLETSGVSIGLLKVLTILLAVADAIAVAVLVVYIIFTRDKHIDYARKVKSLLANYRSYIQRINNPFDNAGYQVLNVDTFPELLEIRDTLQKPILLYENEDQTCAEFFIVTDSGILYSYKIAVEFRRPMVKRTEEDPAQVN